MEIDSPLKTEVINMNCFCTLSWYRAVNTLRLSYAKQPGNAV